MQMWWGFMDMLLNEVYKCLTSSLLETVLLLLFMYMYENLVPYRAWKMWQKRWMLCSDNEFSFLNCLYDQYRNLNLLCLLMYTFLWMPCENYWYTHGWQKKILSFFAISLRVCFSYTFFVTLNPISTHAQLSEEWKKKFFHLLLSMKFNIISVEQNELFWVAGMGNFWRIKFVVLKIMFKELILVHGIDWIQTNSIIGRKLYLTTCSNSSINDFQIFEEVPRNQFLAIPLPLPGYLLV